MPLDWPTLGARNAPLNAFVDVDRAARAGEGPLADLSIGVKSNIAVRGLPWTGGMALRRGIVADRDAAAVAKLRAAGALIPGTLNMHEAALGATTDNHWFGRTHNPHRIGHTPGGSSGGSGAAVAAGLCDAALGTDTLGSVRIPAAYCGVYGLKPSWGAVDTQGLVFLGRRYDAIGPLARSLDVLERVWRVIGPRNSPGRAFQRAVLLEDLARVEVEPEVRAAFERTVGALDLPTASITLPGTPTLVRLAALAEIARELIRDLGPDRESKAELISPDLSFILNALEGLNPDPDLLSATRKAVTEAIGDDGLLVMPTTPQVAFAHGGPPPASQADFTAIANIAGLPALACPAGRGAEGLPVSVQLVGPKGSETRLISLARCLEPALGGAVLPEGVSA